jgi:hypothetical protein
MQKITLLIPEQKLAFFLELVRQLGLEVYEESEVSEAQKEVVRERIRFSDENPESMRDWDKIKSEFRLEG